MGSYAAIEQKFNSQQERLIALGQMVSSVAHEISNPLTSIVGTAQILARRNIGGDAKAEAQRILQEAERATRIARDLLEFARGARSERVVLQINETIRSAAFLANGELRRKGIRLDLELEENLPAVLGNPGQLHQIFMNLLANSEQAITQSQVGSRILIRTRALPENRVAADVIDDGPGIAADVLPRIFDPFFTTKPPGLGTGLGLSIVYAIAHDHGGTVAVNSRAACGAAFTVELPAAPVSAVRAFPSEIQISSRFSKRSEAPEPEGENILVIEDEPAVAQLIADVLAEEGHVTDILLDSREALRRIWKGDYGLVICDLRMPHLSGRMLYQELLRRENPLAKRFIFITGDVLSPATAEFLKSAKAPYLAKPFLMDELKRIVRRTLASSANLQPAAVSKTEAKSNRRLPKARE